MSARNRVLYDRVLEHQTGVILEKIKSELLAWDESTGTPHIASETERPVIGEDGVPSIAVEPTHDR